MQNALEPSLFSFALAGPLELSLTQVDQSLEVQPNIPCGDVKQSSLGKQASLEAMLERFTHEKTVVLRMQ